MVDFSLVISVYEKEDADVFAQCVASVLSQSVLPNEWIIVKDGPLTEGLEAVIMGIRFPNELRIIALPKNVTQGPARAEGVRAARHTWVAIMDSDDICLPDRFEKQLAMLEGDARLGLIGGQIAEFRDDPASVSAVRVVPLKHAAIVKYSKTRNPFNNMTVMMKRELALAAGNYRLFEWFEDYDLWTRMIEAGAVCANHPDVLVNVRVGNIGGGMYARRRGLRYIKSELRMQRQLKSMGIIGHAGYIRNLAVRIPARLLPARGVAAVYRIFARAKTDQTPTNHDR